MKSRKKLYRNLIILAVTLLILAVLVFRYFPFSRLIRIKANQEASFNETGGMGAKAPNSILFDFEVAQGREVPGGIVAGIAHSGNYAAKAFGKNKFTPALERSAGELGPEKLNYISVSAWVYVNPGTEPVNAALVLAASNSVGVNIMWKGLDLRDPGVPRGKWFKISRKFDLGDVKFSKDTRIQLYFWNNSSTDILVDDYYMVYGGPLPRRGDTTFTDLIKGPYTARFNYPPFPVRFLRMEELRGNEGTRLCGKSQTGNESILPSDPMIAGIFLGGNAGKDVLFVNHRNGRPAMYVFCQESRSFRKIYIEVLPDLPGSGKAYLLKGKFIPGETEQLLQICEHSCILAGFHAKKDACSDESTVKAGILWKSTEFENIPFKDEEPLLAGDFNGDGITEVMFHRWDGQWKLFRFRLQQGKNEGKWEIFAEGREAGMDNGQGNNRISLTAGKFIPSRAFDLLLAVKENSSDRKCSYDLKIYSASKKNFISYFPDQYKGQGRIAGIDTLKPGDRFFCGNFTPGKQPVVLRYNRDWRFDLKEISFNDTTFHILSNVDFKGYPEDRNPKYYEVLKLIPGNFTSRDQSSFIVIGCNCKNKDYEGKECSDYRDLPQLPAFISLYTFSKL